MISGIYNKVLKATCSSVTKRQLTCANEDELNCLSSTDGKYFGDANRRRKQRGTLSTWKRAPINISEHPLDCGSTESRDAKAPRSYLQVAGMSGMITWVLRWAEA